MFNILKRFFKSDYKIVELVCTSCDKEWFALIPIAQKKLECIFCKTMTAVDIRKEIFNLEGEK